MIGVAQGQDQRRALIEALREVSQDAADPRYTFAQFLHVLRKLDESGEF